MFSIADTVDILQLRMLIFVVEVEVICPDDNIAGWAMFKFVGAGHVSGGIIPNFPIWPEVSAATMFRGEELLLSCM